MSTGPETAIPIPATALQYGSSPSSPRNITFAASPTRTTANNRRPSNNSSRNSTGHADVEVPRWTEALEQRLLHVQAELKKAQRRWSESQDLWLEEEHTLLDLQRRHKKAQKSDAATRKAAHIWKAKTIGKPKILSLRAHRKNSAGVEDVKKSSSPSRRRHGSISEGVPILSKSSSSSSNPPQEDCQDDDEEDQGDNEGRKLERTNTGSIVTNAMRRLSLSVRSRGGTVSATPPALSRMTSREG